MSVQNFPRLGYMRAADTSPVECGSLLPPSAAAGLPRRAPRINLRARRRSPTRNNTRAQAPWLRPRSSFEGRGSSTSGQARTANSGGKAAALHMGSGSSEFDSYIKGIRHRYSVARKTQHSFSEGRVRFALKPCCGAPQGSLLRAAPRDDAPRFRERNAGERGTNPRCSAAYPNTETRLAVQIVIEFFTARAVTNAKAGLQSGQRLW